MKPAKMMLIAATLAVGLVASIVRLGAQPPATGADMTTTTEARRTVPPIDARPSGDIETATFALG